MKHLLLLLLLLLEIHRLKDIPSKLTPKWWKTSSILTLSFAIGLYTMAQMSELHFQHYTVKDGLSLVETHSPGRTMQDAEGFIWFATMDGLVRYDGNNFKTYRHSKNNPHSLGNNQTTAVCQDKNGNIWIGTGSNGIYIMDPKTEEFVNIRQDRDNAVGLCGNNSTLLATDRDGNIWAGTRFNGVCKYIDSLQRFKSYHHIIRKGYSFHQQNDGTIWIGGTRGLSRYLPEQDSFLIYPLNPKQPENAVENMIHDIAEDALGQLWLVSRYRGLFIFDPQTNTFTDFASDFRQEFPNVRAICADHNGGIYVSSSNQMNYYDVLNNKYYTHRPDLYRDNSIFDALITDLFVDRAGSLWLTNQSEGLSVVHQLNNPFTIFNDYDAWDFIQLDDQNFLISKEQSLYQLNIVTQQYQSFPLPDEISPQKIISLLLTKNQELWLLDGQKAVYAWNMLTNTVRKFAPYQFMMTDDGRGVVSNSRYQLLYFDGISEELSNAYQKVVEEGFPDPRPYEVRDMVVGKDKELWVAADGVGLMCYRPDEDSLYTYVHQPNNINSLANDVMSDLMLTSNNLLCVGTIHGLSILDIEKDSFIHVTEDEGLPHNNIASIVEDEAGNIWVSTRNNISCINSRTFSLKNYYPTDGLTSNKFTQWKTLRDNKGYLYFTTNTNSIRFHPDSLKEDGIAMPVYLLDFYLDVNLVQPNDSSEILQQQLRYTEKITLNHRQTDFGFSFITPVFKKANEITYYYQLEGYDQDWKQTDKTEIFYTNIDAGNYNFQVKAQNPNGEWSTTIARVKISIMPPWWATWWAKIAYVLSFLVIAIFIHRFNLSRQLAKSEARQVKELNRIKSRFYTNITHEFRTPLTVILGMAQEEKDFGKARNLIVRNGQKLLQLINQLLDLSKLDTHNLQPTYQQIEIVSFTQYIGESFQSLADKKYIRLTIYSEVDQLWMDMDEEKYRQIISNLLSNAIKFTRESGKIILHLVKQGNQLQIKIKDNGIGIAASELPHIFDRFYQVDNTSSRQGEGTGIGLALVKELVALMEGEIRVESSLNTGTTFSIYFPIRQTAHKQLTEFEIIASNQSIVKQEAIPIENTTEDAPKLLIIEDNPDVIIYIQSILQTTYEVHLASNGEEGIQKAIESIPDIIISDVMMPKKNGFEVVETLKQDERTSHIPIILLTAKATQADKVEGLKYGADAYLMKPFDKKELLIRLKNLIKVRRKLQAKYADFKPQLQQANSVEERFLKQVYELIEANCTDFDYGIDSLAQALNMSHTQLYRKLKALTNQSASQLIRLQRLKKAKQLLANKQLNISEIAYELGYNDPNYFVRQFTQQFKQSPNNYRKNL